MANSSSNKRADNIKIISIVQSVLGWFMIFLYTPTIIVGLTQLSEALDIVLLVILAGLVLLGVKLVMLGKRKRKLLSKYRDYSIRLAADPDKSLIKLASETKKSTEDVTKDINAMLATGLFQNCYIDIDNSKLVMPGYATNDTNSNHYKNQISYVSVKCRNCGAPNKIAKGSVGECEFCGSQISE